MKDHSTTENNVFNRNCDNIGEDMFLLKVVLKVFSMWINSKRQKIDEYLTQTKAQHKEFLL